MQMRSYHSLQISHWLPLPLQEKFKPLLTVAPQALLNAAFDFFQASCLAASAHTTAQAWCESCPLGQQCPAIAFPFILQDPDQASTFPENLFRRPYSGYVVHPVCAC